MFRESGNPSRRLGLSFAALFAGVAAFPGLTLFSGQVIKQFESYSIARSMSEVGFNPYATTIPCDGGIRWVLELPIFAGIGGIFAGIAPEWPSILPTLVFGLFLFALYRFRERIAPKSSPLPWFAVATAPVFLRFSTQFLADPLAVALLLLGAALFLGGKRAASLLLFLAAVSTKPTVLPSVLFFRWAFAPERKARSFLPPSPVKWLAREALIAVLLVAPFIAWTLSVKWLGVVSPLAESGGILSLGSDWAILLEPGFYSKFLNWTIFKGVGFPLFLFAVYAIRSGEERALRMAAWSIGIIPYWLLVRRLNVVHDYYSLSFFVPIAILGALGAIRVLAVRSTSAWVVRLFLFASIAQGTGLFLSSALAHPWRPVVSDRPIFCGTEFRSPSLGAPVENR